MPLPNLDPLWRPNGNSDTEDLELISTFMGWSGSEASVITLVQQMNSVASYFPAKVLRIQAWLDEIVTLEETQADEVDAGTAHLSSAEEYEGPIPGTTPSRAQQMKRADDIEWDTDLLKARYKFGGGVRASAQGQRDERINVLLERIATALNIRRMAPLPALGAGMLMRS